MPLICKFIQNTFLHFFKILVFLNASFLKKIANVNLNIATAKISKMLFLSQITNVVSSHLLAL